MHVEKLLPNRLYQQFSLVLCSFLFAAASAASAQSGLQVTYGANGVQTLAYNGVVLEDLNQYPADAFHIWHMKATDLAGNPNYSGQYGWGENHNFRQWDAGSHTMTYGFVWGSVQVHFVQSGDNLDLIVTETNNPGSGIVFDGAEIFPVTLHFPQDPRNFSGYTQYLVTSTGPGVSAADFGSGVVTSVIPNESTPLYGGWKIAGSQAYSPILTSTSPDGLAEFLPHNDAPVQPGASLTYTVSLRFTPEGTDADASDAYASFASTYPSQMTWTDKRIIGTAYLASSPSNPDKTQPGGFPTNPRRYFNDPSVDLTTPSGRLAFQNRILTQASTNVSTTHAMGGQGVITWDLEGEQYPQDTTYVCSPDQVATVAPEMETTVKSPSSPYFGMKLDDAYFKTMSDAGLKIGLCLRPQVFALGPNGTASQSFLTTNAAIVANLENKAKYANGRWGATIFYVDSTVNPLGGTLDPAIFQQLITDLPSFLFIPEESTPRYYAYSAPFYSFIFHTDLGTPLSTYKFYPKAFGANLVNDVSPATLAQYQPQLTQSVARGDILMGHADYLQENDPTLVAIYKAAGAGSTAPDPVAPALTWNPPAAIPYGTALSGSQLNASANVPGSFTYTPAAGTVPAAGLTTLMATFTPADSTHYTSKTVSVPLTVTQATPVLNWPAPASIVQGTPLSAAQLNASANVPGTFTYSPAAGTVPALGTVQLTASFTPSDAQDYTSAVATQYLTISSAAQQTPVLSWPAPAPIVYGTALSAAQLDATANVAGTFVYTPPAGTVLNAGNPTLVTIFTPSDTTSYRSTTGSTSLSVTPATPVLSWAAPAPIVFGTPLSAAQLNATASVPGSFAYAYAPGSILSAGSTVLGVVFTPADSLDYRPASATTSLTVTRATPAISWPAPAPVAYGTALSAAQLNATANVPGSFLYSPPAGTLLNAGANVLQATFLPADSNDYTSASSSVVVTVNQAAAAPVNLGILYPADGQTVSGTITVVAQVKLNLDPAGSFLIVDGVYLSSYRASQAPYVYPLNTSTLSNGPHLVQLWAHDIGNNVTISAPISITVAN